MGEKWITAKAAAAILGVTPGRVVALIRQGIFSGKREQIPGHAGGAPFWVIREEVESRRTQMSAAPEDSGLDPREWIKLPEASRILGVGKSAVINRKDAGLMQFRMRQEGSHKHLYFLRTECEQHAKVAPRKSRQVPLKAINASHDDCVWLAGFCDGEGYICIVKTVEKGYTRWRMTVGITNTAINELIRIQSLFGGTFCRLGRDKRPSKWNLRPAACWNASGNAGLAVLYAIRPFLRIKHQQADLAIEFQEHLRAGGRAGVLETEQAALDWREIQRQKISRLNRPNLVR